MDGVAAVPAVRASALTAAIVWILLHLALAAMFANAAARPGLCALGLLVFVAAAALALRPLAGPAGERSEPRWVPVALAVATPLCSLLDVAALEPGAVVGYANWAAGATGVLVAALIMRDHGLLALASGFALVVVQTVGYLAQPGPAELVRPVLLAVPPELWLLGSWTIRGVIRRADDAALGLRARAAEAVARRTVDERSRRMRDELVADLDERVVPFLRAVAEGEGPVAEGEEVAAGRVAAAVRDDLRARSLLDDDVRRALGAARARGCRVLLRSEVPAGPRSTDLGRLLVAVLAAGPSAVVLHAQVEEGAPDDATLVLTGGPDAAAFEDAVVRSAPTWQVVRVVDVDGELVATLQAVPEATVDPTLPDG